MNPAWILSGISILVILGTFLIGRWSKRWMDQGASDAKAVALKEIADRLEAKVASMSEGAVRREEQIKTLVARCDALGDEQAACSLRLSHQECSMASLHTFVGLEDTGKHFRNEPGRDSEGSGVVGR